MAPGADLARSFHPVGRYLGDSGGQSSSHQTKQAGQLKAGNVRLINVNVHTFRITLHLGLHHPSLNLRSNEMA